MSIELGLDSLEPKLLQEPENSLTSSSRMNPGAYGLVSVKCLHGIVRILGFPV